MDDSTKQVVRVETPDRGGENRLEEVLANLAEAAADPVHKRLIEAYTGTAPLDAMVSEFKKVLGEVARGEA